ncbi:MAG: glycosyltransferase [Elusimicrobia bacterium]|nr:glycosyltransferase [Elusimicrobiota bacterium]
MLSVIVSSQRSATSIPHCRSVARTVGTRHEYLLIANPEGRLGLAAAYNRGVARSTGEVLVFSHDDAFPMTPGWGAVLERKFAADPSVGLLGVAGTRLLSPWDLRWEAAGPPFLRGSVVQEARGGPRFLSLFSWDRTDAEVVAADGLFLAVRAGLFSRVRFDEERFGGFHFYDLDLCMQVRRTRRCVVTSDILVRHRSSGLRDKDWSAAAAMFREKYRDVLPASCAPRGAPFRGFAPLGRGVGRPGRGPSEVRHFGLAGQGGRVLRRLGLLP